MLVCPDCSAPCDAAETSFACRRCGARYPVKEGIPSFIEWGAGAEGYRPEFFTMLGSEPSSDRRHFWFRARNDLIFDLYRAYVASGNGRKPKFLEVGCGTGVVLEHLIHHGVQADGLDAFVDAVRTTRARTGARVWLADARRLPFAEEFDAVGLFDCLEHIREDAEVLAAARRALRPGGTLLMTVPAGRGLWSRLDVLMGHYRRYAKSELVEKIRRAGFELLKVSHYNLGMVPACWMQRKLMLPLRARVRGEGAVSVERALRVPPMPLNETMYRLMGGERWLFRRGLVPWGASLAAAARRP